MLVSNVHVVCWNVKKKKKKKKRKKNKKQKKKKKFIIKQKNTNTNKEIKSLAVVAVPGENLLMSNVLVSGGM